MKATEQYFHVVLFTMLYKVALTLESVEGDLKCDQANEKLSTTFLFPISYGAVYYSIQASSDEFGNEILKRGHSNESYSKCYFPVALLFSCLSISISHFTQI